MMDETLTYFFRWYDGWKLGGGICTKAELKAAWNRARSDGKPNGSSWESYGYLMAREQKKARENQAVADTLEHEGTVETK